MTGNGGDDVISGWEQHPAFQVESLANLQDFSDDGIVVAKVGDADRVSYVARVAGDGPFVVDDANGNASATQAAHDPQPLVISTDYDGPGHALCR